MFLKGETIGLVELGETRGDRTITPEQIATAESICQLIAMSIHDKDVLATQERHARKLEALLASSQAVATVNDIGAELAVASNPEKLWSSMALRLSELVDLPDCDVYRLMDDGRLVCLASVYDDEPCPELRGALHQEQDVWASTGEAVRTREPVFIPSPADPRLGAVEREDMRAWRRAGDADRAARRQGRGDRPGRDQRDPQRAARSRLSRSPPSSRSAGSSPWRSTTRTDACAGRATPGGWRPCSSRAARSPAPRAWRRRSRSSRAAPSSSSGSPSASPTSTIRSSTPSSPAPCGRGRPAAGTGWGSPCRWLRTRSSRGVLESGGVARVPLRPAARPGQPRDDGAMGREELPHRPHAVGRRADGPAEPLGHGAGAHATPKARWRWRARWPGWPERRCAAPSCCAACAA